MQVGEIIGYRQALRSTPEAAAVRGRADLASRARGDHKLGSDLDVLVDGPQGPPSSLDLVGGKPAIGDRIGIPANAFLRRSLKPLFPSSIVIESDRRGANLAHAGPTAGISKEAVTLMDATAFVFSMAQD